MAHIKNWFANFMEKPVQSIWQAQVANPVRETTVITAWSKLQANHSLKIITTHITQNLNSYDWNTVLAKFSKYMFLPIIGASQSWQVLLLLCRILRSRTDADSRLSSSSSLYLNIRGNEYLYIIYYRLRFGLANSINT